MSRQVRLRIFIVLVLGLCVALHLGAGPLGGSGARWWELLSVGLAVLAVLALEVNISGAGAFSLESPLVLGAGVAFGTPWLPLLVFVPAFAIKRHLIDRRPPRMLDLYNIAMVLCCYVGGLRLADRILPGAQHGPELIWKFSAAYFTFLTLNTLLYLCFVVMAIERANWTAKLPPLFYEMLTLLVCAPLGVLGLWASETARLPGLVLTAIPLGMSSFAFRQYFLMRERHRALQRAQRQQAVQIRLANEAKGTVDEERFYRLVLRELAELLPVRRMAIAVTLSGSEQSHIFRHGPVTAEDGEIDAWLKSRLGEGALEGVTPYAPDDRPLGPEPVSGLRVALATEELVFGALLVEREAGIAFEPDERSFLELLSRQLSAVQQDHLLKSELHRSNSHLESRNSQFSRILEVSETVKVGKSLEEALTLIARAIRECSGFRVVLISLYRPDSRELERVAQAGLDAQWGELKGSRRASEVIMRDFQPENKVLNSYYIRYDRNIIESTDVLSMTPRRVAAGEWHAHDALLVPMFDREGRMLGMISVDDPEDRRSPSIEVIRVLEILANQAVAALEAARSFDAIRKLADHDGLTGICNHRRFQELLAAEVRRDRRTGERFALALFDLDHFKSVNDTRGHPVGDQVLREAARRIQETVRDTDTAARYGGEEFAVIYPGLDGEEARLAAERIRVQLASAPVPVAEGEPVAMTISAGVAVWPDEGRSASELLDAADRALYEAKRAGRNRVARVRIVDNSPAAATAAQGPPDPTRVTD